MVGLFERMAGQNCAASHVPARQARPCLGKLIRVWAPGAALLIALGLTPSPVGAAGIPGTPGFHPSGPRPAATGVLTTLYSTELHGGYVAAGVGMRNRGFGHLTISGIPNGAKVTAAFLLWDVLDDSNQTIDAVGVVNSNFVRGTLIGSGASPCWPPAANFGFEADITPLVSGNGIYALSGFASGAQDGSDPWVSGSPTPALEGASIVAIYSNSSSPLTHVEVDDGTAETSGNQLSTSFSGFAASANPVAQTTFIVADGQSSPDGPATFNGVALNPGDFQGLDPQDGPAFSQGNLWDTSLYDVSSDVHPGDTSATATIVGTSDCLVWVGQALSVSGQSFGTPSSPQFLNIGPTNGGVVAVWTAPKSDGGAPILGYTLTATPVYTDRIPRPSASAITRNVSSTTQVYILNGLVEDCHERYVVSVSARNAAGIGAAATSSSFRPSGIVAPHSVVKSPAFVLILVDGVNESQPGFTMDPYTPTLDGSPSYCPEAWNASMSSEAESDFAGSPAGPWSFFHKWNFGEVDSHGNGTGNDELAPRAVAIPSPPQGISPGTYTHSFMLDAVAAQGAIILPFSYKGYGFSSAPNHDPLFTFYGYSACQSTPGCGPTIDSDASLLASEVSAAARTWPASRIVVMGHSQGGLVAFAWWVHHSTQSHLQVAISLELTNQRSLCGHPHLLGATELSAIQPADGTRPAMAGGGRGVS